MNTFLPYPSIDLSVSVLDRSRLGKQRVEAFQCLCALGDPWAMETRYRRTGKRKPYKGWVNHPAVKMWRGYELGLRMYYNACIQEWISRGYNNTMELAPLDSTYESAIPFWWGDERVHKTHRGRLIEKLPEWYSQFWNDDPIPESEGYFWPV